MKVMHTILTLLTTLILIAETQAVTVTINNDSYEEITVRIRYRDQDTKELYWTDWVHVPNKTTIQSKKTTDQLFGFAMLGGQASQNISLSNKEAATDDITGRIFLVNDFHSSIKHFEAVPYNTNITIRDAKIELSAFLNGDKRYWTATYVRD